MVDRGSFSDMRNDLSFVDDRIRSCAPLDRMTPLFGDFRPDNWSVICGRGKECFQHPGNRRLRVLIEINLDRYAAATTKMEKSLIVMSLVDIIRENSKGGGFVKRDPKTKMWYEVGDKMAREKVGQQIREALAQRNPHVKQRRRRSQSSTSSNKSLTSATSTSSKSFTSAPSASGTNVATSLTSLTEDYSKEGKEEEPFLCNLLNMLDPIPGNDRRNELFSYDLSPTLTPQPIFIFDNMPFDL